MANDRRAVFFDLQGTLGGSAYGDITSFAFFDKFSIVLLLATFFIPPLHTPKILIGISYMLFTYFITRTSANFPMFSGWKKT